MREKFGRRLRDKDAFGFDFSADFEVESYLRYRGSQFVTRFDANSYLYITKAMDYFDLSAGHASLAAAFERTKARFLILSFTSDWLYPTYQSLEVVQRPAHPQYRCRLLRTHFELWSRCLPGGNQRAERNDQRISQKRLRRYANAAAGPPLDVKASISAAPGLRHDGRISRAGSRVLDLGCGEGELLAWLRPEQKCQCARRRDRPNEVRRAIARGVSAYQSDIEQGLADYPDSAFDFIILSQTLQEMRYPLRVLREMLRVGRHVIVALPNFGHWTTRLAHLFSGRSPRTELFPYDWYESPNLHFLTIYDFVLLCRAENWVIERADLFAKRPRDQAHAELVAEVGVFSIRRG